MARAAPADAARTVVGAVREGRGIYDNIVTITRFQPSTASGFVLTLLVTAVQVLFVNLIMDGPPAMSLGVDPVSRDAMHRPPRPPREPILTRARLLRILLASAVMAAGRWRCSWRRPARRTVAALRRGRVGRAVGR